LEHFIIHNAKGARVQWKMKNSECISLTFSDVTGLKKRTINYLIIDKELNSEILLNYDIVEKINLIKEYYRNELPKHVSIFIEEIEKMDAYHALVDLKEKGEDNPDQIRKCYDSFLVNYFSEENERMILVQLEGGIAAAFRNN
ncbi:MAG: hypothetical protein LIO39_00070, partial [Lachnospiraceae bacterium]|nr:hypothetical protein [Lachnospiraceae bacterium]